MSSDGRSVSLGRGGTIGKILFSSPGMSSAGDRIADLEAVAEQY